MEEGIGKSADIEEWMKELLPDVAAESAGMGRGVVTVPPPNVSTSSQQIRTMVSLGQNYQVPPPNTNQGMWQQSQRTLDNSNNPVRPNISLPAMFEEFSQSQASHNMIPKLHQQQQLQNQVLGQASERQNMYQMRVQPNTHPNNLRQLHQQQTSVGGFTASQMMKPQEAFNVIPHTADHTTFQKSLETKRGLVSENMLPRLQMPAFNQSRNLALVNQLKKGSQPLAMHLSQPRVSESTLQVGLPNSMDWVNEAFQKLQNIKDTYLSDVAILLNKVREESRRATSSTEIAKYEKMGKAAENLYNLLNQSKSALLTIRKDKLFQLIEDALKQCVQIRAKVNPSKQTQRVETSGGSQLEAPQMQQRENYYQFNCAPAGLQQQSLRQGGGLILPDGTVNLSREHKADTSSVAHAIQYSNAMINIPKWTSHGNMVPSPPQKGSQIGFDQRSLRMLLHPPDGASQLINNVGSPQQMVASPRNIFNSWDFSICSQGSIPISPQNKQQQDQAMKRQKMKQPMQQLLSDKNKQQMFPKRNEDKNLRRFVGFNQKMSSLPPSCSSPYAVSPQNSQQSSSQLEQKDLSSKLSKSGTPPMSTSPSAFPSPLTPLTPSSTPADYAKSPLSLEESSKLPKTSAAPSQLPLQDTNQSQLVADPQGLPKSCMQMESTCPGNKQSSCFKGDPFKRLADVVKSLSSRALNAALQDIDVVTSSTDRIAVIGEPPKAICQDLAHEITTDESGRCTLETNTAMKSRMKRRLETTLLNDLTADAEYCTRGGTNKVEEAKSLLLQEIKEVNHKLIQMAVDVMDAKDVSRTGFKEGTFISCSYVPIGHRNSEMSNTTKQMFPNLVLELIVATDYPSSSPTVVESIPPSCSDAEEKDLWMKAKSKFNLLLRKLSQPVSVIEMAEAWDVCTREVYLEFAEQKGGGSFSTSYGKWEDCVLAA